ncbi:MAG: phosphoribosyltransferase family protein [Sulfobacillus sp.]
MAEQIEPDEPKGGRSVRLVRLMNRLMADPGVSITLQELGQATGAAKSTLSEDVAAIDRALEAEGRGYVERTLGPAGGVRYLPFPAPDKAEQTLDELAAELSRPDRRLQGEFLYLTDIVFSPLWVSRLGEIFASLFAAGQPDMVLTVETKGIPLALMTARALGIPLAVARREAGMTEGPALGLNYLSGTARRIGTMSLARRAVPEGSRVLIIDDFLKGGGTARGLIDMMAEFNTEVTGVGVLISTRDPEQKLISDYVPLLELIVDGEGTATNFQVIRRLNVAPHGHGGRP